MNSMTTEDYNETMVMFEQMRAQGWNPRVCDTPVPYYENKVPCGVPSEVGDTATNECMMMPREMVHLSMTYMVDAFGESMRDAGIEDGDTLEVQSASVARDGDIVVAWVNGAYTVKGFYEDEYGRRWLSPCNTSGGYKPILFSACENGRILGRVVSIRKRDPRAQLRMMHNAVKACEEYATPYTMTLEERIRRVIKTIASMVTIKRQWYAVFRALVDKGALSAECYEEFVQILHNVIPEHSYLPTSDELRRMEVQSFRHRVNLWDEANAPVTGARFEAYLRIANATLKAF